MIGRQNAHYRIAAVGLLDRQRCSRDGRGCVAAFRLEQKRQCGSLDARIGILIFADE